MTIGPSLRCALAHWLYLSEAGPRSSLVNIRYCECFRSASIRGGSVTYVEVLSSLKTVSSVRRRQLQVGIQVDGLASLAAGVLPKAEMVY